MLQYSPCLSYWPDENRFFFCSALEGGEERRMPKLHPLPAAFIIDWEGHFINIVGTPTPHFYLTDSFVSPHKFAGISSRAQDRDAYRFLVKGRNDWEAFFFHWRAGVSVEALAVPHSGCFHQGLLRLLAYLSNSVNEPAMEVRDVG